MNAGLDKLPCVKSIVLKNNGIADEHKNEILALFAIKKITKIDLSCNEMQKLGFDIGRRLTEVTHIEWIDLTQNYWNR